MKGLILSGGKGTRLRPLTFTSAKQLLPVANRSILFLAIDAMRDAGIHDIGIIVGSTAKEVKRAVGDGSSLGVRITYIEQLEPLGLAHAVWKAESFLAGSSFAMMLGDNLIHGGIGHAVRQFIDQSPDALVLSGPVDEPEHFGIIQVHGDQVTRLIEKPSQDVGNLALCGVYLFQPIIHRAIHSIQPSTRGELEITDAIQWLVDQQYSVTYAQVSSWWKDTGRPCDLLDANRLLLEDLSTDIQGSIDDQSVVIGPVYVGPGTIIKQTTLRGPISIGCDCYIDHAYIGPYTSLGDDVSVVDTEIEYSVVLSGCAIVQGPRLDQCLLGRNVQINRAKHSPHAFHMVLGDSSTWEWACHSV
ncbi:glucose-1-phosphate thymidylyltransferase [Sulfoacidibacillus ferrooxidans]|uniref:Bifunctional protein GlmU n=1 Tax=Sulfoacidibacillus ferrooxidans TaxID=2005001 RepID=A0A9X1VA23_9BACL|nr:glucose-1-phosphate thymidylyltransferase [Sulfoacidibacillus ferrooxidans]MCI0184441.1 Bifunctional protein GlmU [Sulfoacidibacillus ferrooxidans]